MRPSYHTQSVRFAAGFSYLASRYKLPASPSQVAGAVSQIWLFGSTAGYLAYRAVRFLGRRFWGPTFDPSRRRLLNAARATLLVSVPESALSAKDRSRAD